MTIDIKAEIKNFANFFNSELEQYFPMPQGEEKRVVEAMRYSVLNGGKRLRPFLVAETSKLFDVLPEYAWRVGAALEMLHVYSLIHDDLPAMDNDDLRRGMPTCHKQFDEATAILAGDALLNKAFEVMAEACNSMPDNMKARGIAMMAQVGKCSGSEGMIGGQVIDLDSEGKDVDLICCTDPDCDRLGIVIFDTNKKKVLIFCICY